MPAYELTVRIAEKDAGRKIKYFARSEMKISYSQYCAMKACDGLRVNGVPVHANYLLRAGDIVTATLPEGGGSKEVAPENLPVNIVYCDNDLLIVDKDAPLACQCTPKQPTGTLENRLAWLYREQGDFVFRPVNRLDKGTSGLMAVARHAHAYQLLQSQLHTPNFVREYLAVVEGELAGEGRIDLPIAKEDAATVRRVIDLEYGKPAVTHYRALSCGNGRTLVRLRLETGRTHQIRVHMAAIGHPVAGDFLYGHELAFLPGRFALHSAAIELDQPLTGARIHIESPLPDELKVLLTQ